MNTNQLTTEIFGAVIEVHKEHGQKLLESTYERGLAHEQRFRNGRMLPDQFQRHISKRQPSTYR